MMLLFAEQGCLQKLTQQVCVLCVRPTGLFILPVCSTGVEVSSGSLCSYISFVTQCPGLLNQMENFELWKKS